MKASNTPPDDFRHLSLEQVIGELAKNQLQIAAIEARNQRLLAAAAALSDASAQQNEAKARKPRPCDAGCLIQPTPCTDQKDCQRSWQPQNYQEMSRLEVYARIGAKMRVTDRTIARWVDHAERLTKEYAATQELLRQGGITMPHTVAICDAGLIIGDAEKREQYEQIVLGFAANESVNRVQEYAKRVAERFSEQSIDERARESRKGRNVSLKPIDDDLALLSAALPLTEATGIMDRLTRMAWAVWRDNRAARTLVAASTAEAGAAGELSKTQLTATDTRTVAQIRADLLIDLMLTGLPVAHGESLDDAPGSTDTDVVNHEHIDHPGNEVGASGFSDIDVIPEQGSFSWAEHQTGAPSGIPSGTCGSDSVCSSLSGITAHIQVVIPLIHLLPEEHLAKLREIPGFAVIEALPGMHGSPHIVGQGPMNTETAKFLAGCAPGWDRILTHPVTGAVEHVDRYQPTASLKRLLRARDEHCRFPGCRISARRCEIDHTIAWAEGGRTTASNLAHLCTRHHRLKHYSNWKVKQREGGVLEWYSPTGEKHVDRPSSTVTFAPPSVTPPPF